MAEIHDIETEQRVVKTRLRERYGREAGTRLADADIRLHVSDCESTTCPARSARLTANSLNERITTASRVDEPPQVG